MLKKVDNIWQEIENNEIKNETIEEKKIKNKIQGIKIKLTDESIIVNNELEQPKELLAGLFDPAENDLNLDMWSISNGMKLKIIKKINSKELSNFSKKIMDIVLLTNSYLPEKDITSEEFQNYTIEYLIKKDYI